MDNEVSDHAHFFGLKLCWRIFDQLMFIFDYENVGHGMWWQVPLMPMVMKFGPTDEQFSVDR